MDQVSIKAPLSLALRDLPLEAPFQFTEMAIALEGLMKDTFVMITLREGQGLLLSPLWELDRLCLEGTHPGHVPLHFILILDLGHHMDLELRQAHKHPKGLIGFTDPAHLKGQGHHIDPNYLTGKDLLNVQDLPWEWDHLNVLEHLKDRDLLSGIDHLRGIRVSGLFNTKEIFFHLVPTKTASIPLNPDL